MTKRILTEKQIEQLEQNPSVERCSPKSITYHPDFKAKALDAYVRDYRSVREIFESAGFDLGVIGKNTPKECISRWKKNGITGKRGGVKRVFPTLEAQVAYLKAENAFLRKLRAKRAE